MYSVRGSQWPFGPRHESAAARLLGLRVRIPPETLMSVSRKWCVLSGRVLCDGFIPCGVPEYDREASLMRKPWPTRGFYTVEKTCIFSVYA